MEKQRRASEDPTPFQEGGTKRLHSKELLKEPAAENYIHGPDDSESQMAAKQFKCSASSKEYVPEAVLRTHLLTKHPQLSFDEKSNSRSFVEAIAGEIQAEDDGGPFTLKRRLTQPFCDQVAFQNAGDHLDDLQPVFDSEVWKENDNMPPTSRLDKDASLRDEVSIDVVDSEKSDVAKDPVTVDNNSSEESKCHREFVKLVLNATKTFEVSLKRFGLGIDSLVAAMPSIEEPTSGTRQVNILMDPGNGSSRKGHHSQSSVSTSTSPLDSDSSAPPNSPTEKKAMTEMTVTQGQDGQAEPDKDALIEELQKKLQERDKQIELLQEALHKEREKRKKEPSFVAQPQNQIVVDEQTFEIARQKVASTSVQQQSNTTALEIPIADKESVYKNATEFEPVAVNTTITTTKSVLETDGTQGKADDEILMESHVVESQPRAKRKWNEQEGGHTEECSHMEVKNGARGQEAKDDNSDGGSDEEDSANVDMGIMDVKCDVCQEIVPDPLSHKCTNFETRLKLNSFGELEGEEVITRLPLLTITYPKSSSKAPQSTVSSRTGKHKCNLCSKQFPRQSSYDEHYMKIHNQPHYKCNLCAKEFRLRLDYARHHQKVHMGIRFKCDLCDALFVQKTSFYEHRQKVHLGNGFQCNHCPETFTRSSNLNRHVRSRCPAAAAARNNNGGIKSVGGIMTRNGNRTRL